MKPLQLERRKSLNQYGTLLEPGEAIQPILARPVRDALTYWLTEIWAAKELNDVGLLPRKRALFDGPPGVGKTTLAHHLAARLGLPMLAIHPEKMIDKWLGSTGRNIGGLFDAAAEDKSAPVVLFFDEFDGIAQKRRASEHGADDERNSWVNTLLQRIERYNGYIIAATNHGKSLDPAIWRRFDIHIELAMPGHEEICRILTRYLAPYGLPVDALNDMAIAFDTASPALIRQFCEGLKRAVVLGPRLKLNMQKEAVIERLIAAVMPHPDLGKPRLWSHGARDNAVRVMPWPLPMAEELKNQTEPDPPLPPEGNVATFPGKEARK